MRRASAAVLLAIMTLVTGGPIACAGWEPSGTERMACCKRAGHGHSVDPSMADSCCAGQEQTHQSGTAVSVAELAAPAAASALLSSVFEFNAADVESGRRLHFSNAYRFHDPPGRLGPPLRI
jgi:hypothetical protein